jgi:hypothetical protein
MRALIIAAMAALAAGCLQRVETGPSPQQQIADNQCDVRVFTPWRPLSGVEFVVVAQADGPDCNRAAALLTIRDGGGGLLWSESFVTDHVMTLSDAATAEQMRTALTEWIDPANNTVLTNVSALPEWPEEADAPESGEFPFYPEPWLDREGYEAMRAAGTPLYCYVQGMESLSCVTIRDGRMEKVGVQAFPG